MEELARFVATNPWVVILLAGCTLVSVPLAVWGLYVTYKQHREKRPCYTVESNNLILGLVHMLPDLEIKFHGYGSPIANLTVTDITFWNRGRAAIRKSDIAKLEPLIISMAPNCLILNVLVVRRAKAENAFEVTRSQDRTHASINFDFLDHNDGVVIQVVHTGTSSEDVAVKGTVIEGGTPIRIRPTKGRPLLGIVLLAICITLMAAILLPSLTSWSCFGTPLAYLMLGFFGMGLYQQVVALWRRPPSLLLRDKPATPTTGQPK